MIFFHGILLSSIKMLLFTFNQAIPFSGVSLLFLQEGKHLL